MNDRLEFVDNQASHMRANAMPVEAPKRSAEGLLHKLQVHQIELEMQNEALIEAQVALEESRDRFVDFYEFAPVGYLTLTDKGLIADINRTGAALLGVDRAQLLQRSFARFITPEDEERWRSYFFSILNRENKPNCELTLRHQSELRRHVRLDSLRLVRGGQAPTVRVVLTDITERKQIEAELRVAKIAAEKANAGKSCFLAEASHDLRQSITTLSMYAGMLNGEVSPAGAEVVANIQRCTDSLSGLINNLLDVSKLNAGAITPRPSDFYIDTMLADLVSVFSAEARAKGLRVQFRDSGTIAHTDRHLLQRILGNLVANAIRYTDRGGVLIACRRHRGKQWVEVWDTGMGIPEGKTGIIFKRFKKLGDGERNGGSGLGLAIVAKMTALLGLEIRLRSRPGRGSMFAVELPPARAIRPDESPVSRPTARTLRIGLVEDHAMILEELVRALGRTGNEVIGATSGGLLLERLGNRVPDIVISDYHLATRKNGREVVAEVRDAFGDQLPAIIITGDTDMALARGMADLGIPVLYKPLQIEGLLAAIRTACHDGACTNDLAGQNGMGEMQQISLPAQ